MFCPNCGNQLEDSAKFCAACGTQVGEVNPGAPVATAAPAAPAAPGLGAKLKETLQGYWKSPKEAAATVAADGNFAWAFMGMAVLMWAITLPCFLRETQQDGRRWRTATGWALAAYHVGSGLYYIIYLLSTGATM